MRFSAPLYKTGRNVRGKIAYERGPGREYKFIASGPDQRRSESTGADGITRGSYSYLDDKGIQRTVQYIAGAGIGYRVVHSTTGVGTHLSPRPAIPDFGIASSQSNDISDDEGTGFATAASGSFIPHRNGLGNSNSGVSGNGFGSNSAANGGGTGNSHGSNSGSSGGGYGINSGGTGSGHGRKPAGSGAGFGSNIGGSAGGSGGSASGHKNTGSYAGSKGTAFGAGQTAGGSGFGSSGSGNGVGSSGTGFGSSGSGDTSGYVAGTGIGSGSNNAGSYESAGNKDGNNFDNYDDDDVTHRDRDPLHSSEHSSSGGFSKPGGHRGNAVGAHNGGKDILKPIGANRGGTRYSGNRHGSTVSQNRPPHVTGNHVVLERERTRDWIGGARDSTIVKNVGNWYVGLPPGAAVRAHVQNIDLLPLGDRPISPGDALRQDEQRSLEYNYYD